MVSISVTEYDGDPRPDTPLATLSPSPIPAATLVSKAQQDQLVPTIPLSQAPILTTQILRPIPTPSVNKSQSSFSFPDADDAATYEPLPPEIATADISIGSDGSFVETSSGPAARELKRRYDQFWGVNIDVRSPYAITAFVNQHGKQMYRVGPREASAPAAKGQECSVDVKPPEETPTASQGESSKKHGRRVRRRSRLSMHTLLAPGSMFKNGSISTSSTSDSRGSANVVTRKLRKTRSIPNMFGQVTSESSSPDAAGFQNGPPQFTARAHSHSVTGADLPRLLPSEADILRSDMFGEVMRRAASAETQSSASSSISGSASHSPSNDSLHDVSYSEYGPSRPFVLQPFGPGVVFDSPSRRPKSATLPPPHVLREMQSFESGLTARAADPGSRIIEKSRAIITPPMPVNDVPQVSSYLPSLHPEQEAIFVELKLSPLSESTVHSQFPTSIFDVLQTYSGLPLLDKISPNSVETTVIKMSLRTDGSAAPRDDPRFVIWGEVQFPRESDVRSVSHNSATDVSSSDPSSSLSRRKSGKASRTASIVTQLPKVQVSSEEAVTHKALIAATIERWIAQLTSELDYDEILVFLLTYRTYVDAVSLLHLLMCRFHWSLEPPSTSDDERVRRIVRVRTFVAIRYWLLTFFAVDFLPNQELRLLLADWLNTLVRDPILKKHSDGLSIVRKLRKIVRDCGRSHARTSRSQGKQSPAEPRGSPNSIPGDQFAESDYVEAVAKADREDTDLDLDFVSGDVTSGTLAAFQNTLVSAHLTPGQIGVGLPPPRYLGTLHPGTLTTLPQSSIGNQSRSPMTMVGDAASIVTSSTLPMSQNSTFSRVLGKTFGRLGRWKRMLNSNVTHMPLSAFDLEADESGTVRGQVEQYTTSDRQSILPSPVSPSGLALPPPPVGLPSDVSSTSDTHESLAQNQDQKKKAANSSPRSSFQRQSTYSHSSSDSLGSVIPAQGSQAWHFDVVSIDDLDLSDTSSVQIAAPSVPPGLRKVPRRLPLRRDFEFVRRSGDTVSSMGLSRPSYASDPSTDSAASSEPGLAGPIQQWQVNALVESLSDEEEAGDVEDALRRLEGQINPAKRQEKASKVDGWVRTIQQRMAAGDYGDERPRFMSDDEDEGGEDDSSRIDVDSQSGQWSDSNDDGVLPSQSVAHSDDGDSMFQYLATTPVAAPAPVGTLGPDSSSQGTRAAPDPAVPLEILQSRVPPRPSTSPGSLPKKTPPLLSKAGLASPPHKFGLPSRPNTHVPFILQCRTETIVQHFSMINRELFMAIDFKELVSSEWMSTEEVDVLDWTKFLRDRVRWKAQRQFPQKTTGLAAVRGRFNLIANFTLSEVVLTPLIDRAFVVSKFIRIAYKAYTMHDFSTLVAIMAGLRSDWVTKAMHRLWDRVGHWESRMYSDFTVFVSGEDDFVYIRQAIASVIDAKTVNPGSHAPSVASGGGTDAQSSKSKASENASLPPPACIPFIGVYLSQLTRYSKLPDLIDPTAPNETVGIVPGPVGFDSPAHPEVFSSLTPLPSSMQLEPLINVHKQRLIANTIKDLVSGQHLASRVQYPVDRKFYQKCLKLRALDSHALQLAFAESS